MIDVSGGVPGVNAPDPQTYDEFWAYYLSQHLHPMTRRVHTVGTVAAIVTGLSALLRGRWKLMAASPLLAYVPAFASHWIWEGNNPVVLKKGKPIWAARTDLEMVYKVLTGKIGDEVGALREGLGLRPPEITLADQAKLRPAA